MTAIDLPEGDDLETVEITLRIGRTNFENLATPGRTVKCEEAWLTKQPDGTYALGLSFPYRRSPVRSRLVENDDRAERLASGH